MKNITIGDKEYQVYIAKTQEERKKGLQGVKSLDKDKGMLFIFDEVDTVGMWMKDTHIPLDIIFINDDEEVISIYKGQPMSEDIAEEDNVKYVLEVNQNSGIKEGDDLDFEEDNDTPVMKVIGIDGESQMEIIGGERIFSRKSTRVLIRKAKKAEQHKDDEVLFKRYCKALGKYIFKEINNQDNRDPEYVSKKD